MKYFAAIDIGSNSFHLKIVSSVTMQSFETVNEKRIVHRLAAKNSDGIFSIPENKIQRGIEIIKEFSNDIKSVQAAYIGVATSAVRESSNGSDFLARVLRETGITISVISGTREAELIYKGASINFTGKETEVTVIDIGGGSTEFIKAQRGVIQNTASINVGAVRLSNLFAPEFDFTPESFKECSAFTLRVLEENIQDKSLYHSPIVVGTSGTFNSLFLLKPYLLPSQGESLSVKLIEQTEQLCRKYWRLQERIKLRYIEEKKLEILPAGIIIAKTIAEYFGFKEFYYSQFAIREGMIQELLLKEREKTNDA